MHGRMKINLNTTLYVLFIYNIILTAKHLQNSIQEASISKIGKTRTTTCMSMQIIHDEPLTSIFTIWKMTSFSEPVFRAP